MYKKIKLYQYDGRKKDDFVYEIEHDFLYIDSEKENIYVVRQPTEDELDGFGDDKEMLEFDIGDENNTEVFVVDYTMSIREWLQISDNLVRFVKKEMK